MSHAARSVPDNNLIIYPIKGYTLNEIRLSRDTQKIRESLSVRMAKNTISMSDNCDIHALTNIVESVDNPVGADADSPKKVLSSQLVASGGAGVGSGLRNR